MRLIQVTLGTAATRITTGKIYTPSLFIQNNAAAVVRLGDNTVSATRGIALSPSVAGAPGGSFTNYRPDNRIFLDSYFLFGTAGQVIDVLYE